MATAKQKGDASERPTTRHQLNATFQWENKLALGTNEAMIVDGLRTPVQAPERHELAPIVRPGEALCPLQHASELMHHHKG